MNSIGVPPPSRERSGPLPRRARPPPMTSSDAPAAPARPQVERAPSLRIGVRPDFLCAGVAEISACEALSPAENPLCWARAEGDSAWRKEKNELADDVLARLDPALATQTGTHRFCALEPGVGTRAGRCHGRWIRPRDLGLSNVAWTTGPAAQSPTLAGRRSAMT
jgi:hypothetical protein